MQDNKKTQTKPKKRKKGKRTITVNMRDSHTFITDRLKKKKIAFQIESTLRTKMVKFETEKAKHVYIFSDEIVSYKDMHLLREVKQEVKKQTQNVNVGELDENVTYFDFHSTVKDLHIDSGTIYDLKDVCEVDITKAYYYTARKLGYISDDFFKKCLALPKPKRLRLIGSIATKKKIEVYEGGRLVEYYSKTDEKLRQCWFNIIRYTDNVMKEVKNALDDDFIFYWVDGIYFKDRGYNVDIAKGIFEKFDFAVTYEKLSKIQAVNIEGVLHLEVTKQGGKKKPFAIPKNNIKKYNF